MCCSESLHHSDSTCIGNKYQLLSEDAHKDNNYYATTCTARITSAYLKCRMFCDILYDYDILDMGTSTSSEQGVNRAVNITFFSVAG